MSGCGKPGHVTAGSGEGTQWCATCVTESDALAPYHVRYDVMVYHGDYRLCTCRNEMDAREIAEGMNATTKLRKELNEAFERAAQEAEKPLADYLEACDTQEDIAARIRALKAQKAPLSRGVER